MSRARVHEVSSPISLFPFIGILLCTMGALLVVLVAVSRSAHDTAEREVHEKGSAANVDVDAESQKKLADTRQYIGKLANIRSDAERKLRDENARLSHVEDHIRRLHDKMRTLLISADELEALEQEHYDDREQAERETARLNKLIDESQKTIEALQDAADREPSSYALVPYEGPNGTFRRPIYIECVKDALILQPEGIRITAEDLRRPIGAGNPLAAALRAARDHFVKLYPKEGSSRETEPYPLLLVRPDGLYMFERARQAIEAGDFDLGFELAEADWKVKYPQPNPQLASIEQLAVEQARARQEVLAAAAPRAYRGGSLSFGDPYGDDADSMGGESGGVPGGDGSGFGGDGEFSGGHGGMGGGMPGGGSGGSIPGAGNSGNGNGGGGSGGAAVASGGGEFSGGAGAVGANGGAGSSNGTGGEIAGGTSGYGGEGPQGGAAGSPNGGGSAGGPGGAGNAMGNAGSSSSGGGMPAIATTDPNAPPDAGGNPTNVSVMMGSPPPDAGQNPQFDSAASHDNKQTVPPQHRGKDWALHKKGPRAVPVRRTIRVVVRQDQLAILTDDAAKTPNAAPEAVVRFQGDTVESVDEFVKHVQREIEGWGIAGNGLYWRPVLILTVAPDGGGRASDLGRLLKNSGLELQTEEDARNAPPGGSRETR